MAERDVARLLRLRAEIQSELDRIDRTVTELTGAREIVAAPGASRLMMYGAAALVETFYTGVEKTMARIGATFGDAPDGLSWHRELLDGMALEIPSVRPRVFSTETVGRLERYLAFRHRFRNLYLFDLIPEPILSLIDGLPATWAMARAELVEFATRVEALAAGLAGSG